MAGKWEPFDINGAVFRPKLRLIYVEEPEFGCEGAPDEGKIYGNIVLEDKTGQKKVKIEESQLYSSRLNDGMWIGKLAGHTVLIGRDKATVYRLNDAEEAWLATVQGESK